MLGIQIIRTKRVETLEDRADHWRKMFDQKESYCDKLIDGFKEKEKILNKRLEIEVQHKDQKVRLCNKKDRKISNLKLEMDHLNNMKDGAEKAIMGLQKDNSEYVAMHMAYKTKITKKLKSLKEMIRIRDKKIAALKEDPTFKTYAENNRVLHNKMTGLVTDKRNLERKLADVKESLADALDKKKK